jgi:hypothetical protein
VLCGRFWVAKPLSTRSETCKNQQGILAGNATHNNTSEEKLLLFRAKIFLEKNFMKNLYLNDHLLC